MKIAIAIKTKDRSPGENYLGRTLESLGRGGVWESSHFHSLTVVDGGSPDPVAWKAGISVCVLGEFKFNTGKYLDDVPAQRTLHQTAQIAIQSASHPHSGADYALILEDDIEVCSDFLESIASWLAQHADPGRYPLYSFGANYAQVQAAHVAGRTLWPYPVSGFYGAQAIALDVGTARELAEWLGPDPSYACDQPCCSEDGQPVAVRHRHHDLLLREWAIERGTTHFAASVPSFVQHIGQDSTLDNPPFMFASYPGADWAYTQPAPRRSVLFVGDAACSTGFARCTHAACDALHAAGWDVSVLGLNYYGDPHPYPYDLYPARQPLDGGADPYGVARLPILINRIGPELVVWLNDSWNLEGYLSHLDRRGVPLPATLGWIAVDAENQATASDLNRLDHVATWTRFAAAELQAGGYDGAPSIIPLGVDPGLYRPLDRTTCRRKLYPARIPLDAFVVGCVARNQPRKRLDLVLRAFAEWITGYGIDDAYLYLHVAPGQKDLGVDLLRLTRYLRLQERVILAEPHIGVGLDPSHLPVVYSALSAYLTMSQGEGWGLPVLEAMACGVPTIVPDYAALAEWPGDASLKIPCSTTAPSAPLNDLAFTVGRVPDVQPAVEALHELYTKGWVRDQLRTLGLAKARELTWEKTGRAFVEVAESVVGGRVGRVEEGPGFVARLSSYLGRQAELDRQGARL